MNQKKYVNTIIRKLQCSGNRKKEIRRELESNINSALEQGESWEQIEKRMGSPALAAREFNANFSDKERKTAKRNRGMRIFGIIAAVLILAVALVWWMLPKSNELKNSKKFDEDTVIAQAEKVVELLDSNDFETLKSISTEGVGSVLEQKKMEDVRQQIGSDWGELQSFGSVYTAEAKQMGSTYAVVQMVAVYENLSVTYTISFNESMELSGLYMK